MVFLKYLFIFCLFSVVGWILELSFRSISTKKFVNPGFMSGCVLPIYGFGAVILNIICTLSLELKFNYKILLIFLLSTIILSLLEFISGYVLLKFFHLRLWDYSDIKFNIKGFICLRFSFVWGLLSLIYYYLVFPWINNYTTIFISNIFCLFALGIFFGVFLIDLFISIDLLKKLNEYSIAIKEIINLEKIKIDSIRKSTRKKFWKAIYPYISTNKFLKDKLKK